MNKYLVINLEILLSKHISIAELLYLYSIYTNNKQYIDINIDLAKLEKQQYIKIITIENNEKTILLRDKSIKLIEFLTIEMNNSLEENVKTIKKSERIINIDLERIDEFRFKWKGLKSGAMGSAQACKDKLNRWMKENPQYSFDDILKASDMYINSLNGDYRFLQRADYFIYKQENNREESSRLSAHIDEIDSFMKDDWTTNLK